MSDNKKYYYLKLKDDFFDSDEMIVLESMPDGYMYSNILLKLYLRSLKQEGKLMFRDRIPYNSTILSQVTRHSVGDVEKAVDIFEQLGLIETLDNGAIYMLDIQNFIGQSSTEADRIREYRARIKAEKENIKVIDTNVVTDVRTNVTSERNISTCKSTPEIEIEKDIEKEIDIELQQEQEEKLADDVADYKKAINFYQNNFGVINPHTAEDLQMWIEDIGIDLVIEALKRATENQKNYAYAKGIMRNWVKDNIKTMKDVEAQDVAFTNKKQGYKQSSNEELEEWDYKTEIYGKNWQEEQKKLNN